MSAQETAALIEAVNQMTATVAGKMGQIDQKTAENTAKVDAELAKILTKLPRVVITLNQALDPNTETGLPKGMSVHSGVSSVIHMTMTSNSVRPADQLAILQEMEADMVTNLRKTAYWRRTFRIWKMSWVNKPSWLAFPQSADDPTATSIPLNTFITMGAFVKVLSGSIGGAWADGCQLGKWVFCNKKLSPTGFGSYTHLHPIPNSDSGEILVALPAAITGHIDTPAEWFANINLG